MAWGDALQHLLMMMATAARTRPGIVQVSRSRVNAFYYYYCYYCYYSDYYYRILTVGKFDAGGLGFEFCVLVAGWKHALRSEWPSIIIIIIMTVGKQ